MLHNNSMLGCCIQKYSFALLASKILSLLFEIPMYKKIKTLNIKYSTMIIAICILSFPFIFLCINLNPLASKIKNKYKRLSERIDKYFAAICVCILNYLKSLFLLEFRLGIYHYNR